MIKKLGFLVVIQVDLKLKICRGTSIKKILVREAKSYNACKFIVGTAQSHHKIRSSTTVAKYCANKLPKDCGILAVNNGKVVFNKEGSQSSSDSQGSSNFQCFLYFIFLLAMVGFLIQSLFAGSEDHHRNGVLSAFHRSLHKSSKVLNEGIDNPTVKNTHDNCQKIEQTLAKIFFECTDTTEKQKCSVCSRPSVDDSSHQSIEESSADDGEDKSMAIVPVQREEPAAASSINMLIKELPEARPGWPLLRRAELPDPSERSLVRKISVVQWAMQLPSRRHRQNSCDPGEDQPSCLDGESGAIIPVGSEAMTAPASPDHNSKGLPRELEGLHEKYSSTCRLFNYQELQSATSYFLAGNVFHAIHISKVK